MTLPDRIANKIEIADCWYWTGCVLANGYGQVGYGGTRYYVHRLVYTLLVGPIPTGLQLDHLCRTRHCVNPDHLEPVTPGENTRRGRSHNREKTHCPQGHKYTKANTYTRPSESCRRCLVCVRTQQRDRERSKRELPSN